MVFDGNFSAEQLKMKRPLDDVHLTDGSGFLVAEGPYQEHLKVAIEIKEVRSVYNSIDNLAGIKIIDRKSLVTSMTL